MFSKLKTFSEEVTKSFNELNQVDGTNGGSDRRLNAIAINELKNGAKVLGTKTPDATELTQPEDEPVSKASTPVPGENGQSSVSPTTSNTDNYKEPSSNTSTGATATPTQSNTSQKQDIDLNTLPPAIRSKLKKFVKYEEKYPILLEAFKTEKRKAELIHTFEKVLQENTPVSSIAEAGALVEYLNGLNEKTTLLNTELRKYSRDNSNLTKSNTDLNDKLRNSTDQLKRAVSERIENDRKVDELNQKISLLEADLKAKTDEVAKTSESLKEQTAKTIQAEKALEDTKKEIVALQKKFESNKTNEDGMNGELTTLRVEAATYKSKIKSLEEEVETLQIEKKQQQMDHSTINANELLRHEVSELKEKIDEKDVEIKKLLEAKSKTDPVPDASAIEHSTPQPHSPGNELTKNKKKKNKKKKGGSEPSTPSVQVSKTNVKEEVLANEFSSVQEELEWTKAEVRNLEITNEDLKEENRKMKSELQLKIEDVENLRDSLRDIGDDLVQARDEIKELKGKQMSHVNAIIERDQVGGGTEDKDLASVKLDNEELTKQIAKKEALVESLIKENKELEAKLDDKSRHLESSLKEHETKSTDFEKEILAHLKSLELVKESEASLKSDHEILRKKHRALEVELQTANKEIENFKKEKVDFNLRISELNKFKSNDTSLKLELASLKTSLLHKDQSIREYKDRIQELSEQKDKLNDTISKLRVSNSELQLAQKALLGEKSELVTKQELSIERTNSLTKELNKLQGQKQVVVTELEKLKTKFDTLVKEKSSSSNEYLTFKQQYEELSMKAKESSLRIEGLEDELSEARNLLQERTRESSSIRRLLVDAEEQMKSKDSEMRNELKRLSDEKIEIESSCQSLLKKRQREIDELKAIIESHVQKIQILEKSTEELRDKNAELDQLRSKEYSVDGQNGSSLEEVQQTIETLRSSLQSSAKKVRDYESLNNVLKKLNEESNLKFERLSKNYKIITQQYRQMKTSAKASPASSHDTSTDSLATSPRNSMDSRNGNDGGKEENNATNIAYLKNVLLGFFEHKEQREQLLPVVKTLFHFSMEDEKKFLLALK
ncbi:uncharacterized protein RJT20DRAFT_45660 [Scheffersomyces xylosifermentans]|uniref:uncharacterized protein n=1 Tax=Scheffersomyces xylosifermentans TaxID=1304137 RepID=UPI00315CD955